MTKEDIIKPENLVYQKPRLLNDNPMHYCPGCSHGVVHKLIAEVIDEMGMAEKAVGVSPVGCAVFMYNYLDIDCQEAAHGRAPALATAIKRLWPDRLVFTYQGDGDLACIGTAETIHALNRGENITIQSVSCDVGCATQCLTEEEHRHISARPEDVEDYGIISVTFSDGTKALCIASDTVLGGTKNYIEVYGNNAVLNCNITPTDLLNTYFLDEDGLEDVNISEMLPRKLGWNKAFVSDEMIRGYIGELQDFVETVAYDREPTSNFTLAYDVTKVLYAAYQSAEEGRRIEF